MAALGLQEARGAVIGERIALLPRTATELREERRWGTETEQMVAIFVFEMWECGEGWRALRVCVRRECGYARTRMQ